MFALQWSFTTYALVMICPRGLYYVDAFIPFFHPFEYETIIKLLGKSSSAKWTTNIVDNEVGSTSRLKDFEPGFDFSDEEMKKLKLWHGGIVPYYIDGFSFDKVFRDRIRTFLATTNGVTGLNFIELDRPPDDEKTRWVFFVNRQSLLSCADHSFKNFSSSGVQKVVLGYDCVTTGRELAEVVLAIVGVPPQHNAPDREKYINIVERNIMPGKAYLFKIIGNDEWLFHEMDYDFSSASHYPLHKYTVNGKATINPLVATEVTVGEGKGFSFTDIWKIRMLYNYISKKRLKSMHLPECKVLFNFDSNVSRLEPDSGDDVVPRKKPNKYLGLPEDHPQTPESDSENVQLNIKTNRSEEKVDSVSYEDENFKATKKEDNSAKIKLVESVSKKVFGKNVQESRNKNAIFDLSDFQTDNERGKLIFPYHTASPPGNKIKKVPWDK